MAEKTDIVSQWERMQTQTFTRWVNSHLAKKGHKINSLLDDLKDGVALLLLLEAISGDSVGKYNRTPKHKIHSVENNNRALKFIENHDVKLVSIGAEDILEGNVKLTLGLIWTIILRFAITGLSEEGLSAKEGLLLWVRRKTEPYNNVDVKDFTFSFQDGLAFCALIHRHRPDLIDYHSLTAEDRMGNLNLAFDVAAEHLGMAKLLDAEDIVNVPKPDERSIITYVAELYRIFSSTDKLEGAGRKLGKLLDVSRAVAELSHDYEVRADILLNAIAQKIEELNSATLSDDYSVTKAEISDFRNYLKTLKRSWVGEQEDLGALFSSIQVKLKTNHRAPYVPSDEFSLSTMEQHLEDLANAEHQRRANLSENMRSILDRLRNQYAELANHFNDAINQFKAHISAISNQDLQDQLHSLVAKQGELSVLANQLPAVKAAEDACNAANIEDNEQTNLTYDDLEYAHTRLSKTYSSQINFIENQIAASHTVDVPPELIEEFKKSFNHFDGDKDGKLSRLEFKSALSGLGVVELDFEGGDKRFEAIFQRVVAGSESVSFNQFVDYMVSISKDDTSEETIRDSFGVLAGGKDFVTVKDFTLAQLTPSQIEYLTSSLPAFGGVEGGYDYKAWLNKTYQN